MAELDKGDAKGRENAVRKNMWFRGTSVSRDGMTYKK